WFQLGTFSPVMRMHGDRLPYEQVSAADGTRRLRSGGPNEVWSFGEEAYTILAHYLHLREALRPYLREVMRAAHTDGQPVLRGRFNELPRVPVVSLIGYESLLAPDILVAPVVEAGARAPDGCLPRGVTWTDAATGVSHDGCV